MQLHYAARRGDRKAVLRQLVRGVPIDARAGKEGVTPLVWAADSPQADAEFLRFLLELGADVNAVGDEYERTPLVAAVSEGDLAKVALLLGAGADARFRSPNGYTALIRGCPAPLAVTRLLLEAGAEVDGETPWHESALSIASRVSDWPTVQALLEAGADPAPLRWTPLMHTAVFGTLQDLKEKEVTTDNLAARDRWERTPWLHAVCAGSVEKAKWLLEPGSDQAAQGRGERTALMYAGQNDDLPMTEWLLTLGLDVNKATEFGDTALHEAASHSAVSVIAVLLAAGANVYAENHVSAQPINEASDIETVQLLVHAGADINHVSGTGDWPLNSAAENGDIKFARALLELGASVETTSAGETALHAAVKADNLDMMRLLLDAGADPNAQDVDGDGVLWFARTTEAVDILLDAGTDVHLVDEAGQEVLAYHIDTEIQERLIAAGCSPNPPDITYGTPLLRAVERYDLNQIGFLLDTGADVNAATGWGKIALMEAAINSFTDGVALLLSAEANFTLRDENGRTALHYAAAPEAFTAYTLALEMQSSGKMAQMRERRLEDMPEFLRSFVETDVTIDIGHYGYVESDSVECLNLLVQAGADINAADAAGLTPLSLAASCGRPARVDGLLALGADIGNALVSAEAHPNAEQKEEIIALLRAAEQKEPDGTA